MGILIGDIVYFLLLRVHKLTTAKIFGEGTGEFTTNQLLNSAVALYCYIDWWPMWSYIEFSPFGPFYRSFIF
jgi:hypothetical protein